MKLLIILSLILYPFMLMAQPFTGNWQGAIAGMQNPNQEYPASMNLRAAGSQLTGTVTAQVPTGTETYRVSAQITGNQAAGTVTDMAAGTSMNVELALNNGKLVVAFGLNNVPSIMGVFTQQGSAGRAASPQARNVPSPPRSQDRLPRNTRLIGVWVYTNTYRSGSDFRFMSRSFLYFYPDGRLGSSAGEAAASYDGADGSAYANTGSDGVSIVPGAVWYTKGNQIWLHATEQKLADGIWGEFVMNDNGSVMQLNRGRGKILYERIN